MHVRIKIIERRLSDGSIALDVGIGSLVLTGTTHNDAYKLAEGIASLITTHSLDTAELTEVIGL